MEEQARRSGLDRRRARRETASERRNGTDRRSVVNETDRMISFMKKIPLFSGLTYEQYRKVLYICYRKTLPRDLFIFEQGDRSDSMYILLAGQLKVLYHGSTLVTLIDPVTLVGEIGFFTGEPRLTSAVTTTESSIIKINRTELLRILQNDQSLANRLLLNVINELARKLRKYTEIIQELRSFQDAHLF